LVVTKKRAPRPGTRFNYYISKHTPIVKWKTTPNKKSENMTKKQAKEHNYYCKTCGARFGDDGRAFEVGTLKDEARDWHCYHCKMDEMPPEALKEFAKLQLSKKE